MNPVDLVFPVLVRPKQNNKRILAQNGAFIVFGLSRSLNDVPEYTFQVTKLRVKSSAKKTMLNQLAKLGFNDQSMFPDLESAAKYVKQTYA